MKTRFVTPTRFFPVLLSVAALGVSTGACDGPRNNETVHPFPGRIPGSEWATPITRDSVPGDMAPERLAKWTTARDAIRNARLVVAIGSAGMDHSEHSDPTVFGSVADVVVDPAGLIYVLDEQAQEVRAFDLLGRFVHKFGGFGDGPSELRHAIGIELLGDGRILVASRDQRVRVFAPTEQGWSATETIEAPVGPRAVCSMRDGRVFVNGYRQDANTLVHQLPLPGTGSVAPAFGQGYRDENWLVQMSLAEGALACANGGRGVVVLGHRAIPLIRAFDSLDGSLVWASKLEAFSGMPVYQGVNQSGRNYIRKGRPAQWDVLGSVHPVAEGHLLVQVGHGSMVRRTVSIESDLLDSESGAGAFLGDEVPRAIPFEGGYVALYEDPYPRIEVRAFDDSQLIRMASAPKGVAGQ